MCSARRILVAAVFVATLMAAAARSQAETLWEFSAELGAWEATHVIVATEGAEIDGKLQVVESWRGDAKPGDTIELPGLAAFHDEAKRQIPQDWRSGRQTQTPEQRAVQSVTGQRMVLFLIKKRAEPGEKVVGSANDSLSWLAGNRPVGSSETMDIPESVAWLESGLAYALRQPKNPGPCYILPIEYDAIGLRTLVDRVNVDLRDLEEVGNLRDARERATAFARRANSNVDIIRKRALEGISECGEAGLAVYREILNDYFLRRVHGEAIFSLGTMTSADPVPFLIDITEHELVFWQTTAPGLEVHWHYAGATTDESRRSDLSYHCGRIGAAVYALERRPDPRAVDTIQRLRDFWRSLPQLEDPMGLDEVSKNCDRILKKLEMSEKRITRTQTVREAELEVSVPEKARQNAPTQLIIRLKNLGQQPVVFGHINGYRDCKIQIFDAAKRACPYTAFGNHQEMGVEDGVFKKVLTPVDPGKSHECQIDIAKCFELKPGRYSIAVSLELDPTTDAFKIVVDDVVFDVI